MPPISSLVKIFEQKTSNQYFRKRFTNAMKSYLQFSLIVGIFRLEIRSLAENDFPGSELLSPRKLGDNEDMFISASGFIIIFEASSDGVDSISKPCAGCDGFTVSHARKL